MRSVRWFLGVAGVFLLSSVAWAQGDFLVPSSGPITSNTFSLRSYGYHSGIDIASPPGAPIGAARAGTAVFADWAGGYGYCVILDHGNGYSTRYAHLSVIGVSVGKQVEAGRTIGWVGNSGVSSGPHLHFDILRWDVPRYIPAEIGAWFQKGGAIPYDYPGLLPISGIVAGMKVLEVKIDVLNVRATPSPNAAIVRQAPKGERFVMNAGDGSWKRIWIDGRSGWVHGSYVAVVSQAPAIRITASVLNVRSSPGQDQPVVGLVHQGEHYPRLGALNGWIKVFYGGEIRWVWAAGTATVWP